MYLLLDGPLNGQYVHWTDAYQAGYVEPDAVTAQAWNGEAILVFES